MAQQAKPSFTVATRFWEPKLENLPAAVEKLRKWVDAANAVGAADVLIAINVKEDAGTIAACKAAGMKAHFMAIENWGKFVPSLNAMLYETNRQGVPYILYASAEFPVQQVVVDSMLTVYSVDHGIADYEGFSLLQRAYVGGLQRAYREGGEYALRPDIPVVVGAAFGEHSFERSFYSSTVIENSNGNQMPWNTMAMWSVERLMFYCGFPSSGDWPADPKMAGVEEFDVLALACNNGIPQESPAVLLRIPEFDGYKSWNTDGWDAARHEAHAKKIASKIARPEFRKQQMGWTEGPYVIHIDTENMG